MVTTWTAKIKRILSGFLATEDDVYLTTEGGLKLQIIALGEWTDKSKS